MLGGLPLLLLASLLCYGISLMHKAIWAVVVAGKGVRQPYHQRVQVGQIWDCHLLSAGSLDC
ncbi:hypothetical protein [Edwardsiella tarda]|uniref:hypothetical protein n=1 Tax=Edwardsiella tarda TaxID=636 RepID=UPI00351C8D7B